MNLALPEGHRIGNESGLQRKWMPVSRGNPRKKRDSAREPIHAVRNAL
jgi:hypothetical protein